MKKRDKSTKICIVIMIIAIISVVVTLIITNSQNNNYSSSITSKEENPYKVANEYDGTYSFKMESSYDTGYSFISLGIITFENGKCKAKYVVQSEGSDTDYKYEYEGFCGLNNNDENNFYFNLNKGNYIYKCLKSETGFDCILKSDYDLSRDTKQANLKLESLNNTDDLNAFYSKFVNEEKAKWKAEKEKKKAEEKAKKEAEEKAQKEVEEKSFKESCKTFTFEQIARNPENFKGTKVKLTGEVIQALYDTNSVDLRVNITKKGNYSPYYTDTIYVTYNTTAGEDKILENDIITIYGTSMGDYTYKSTIGAIINLPLISAKYIEINN